MCLAIPAQIVEIQGERARVELAGNIQEADLSLVDSPAVGDWVLLHAGFAIEKLTPQDAEIINTFNQIIIEKQSRRVYPSEVKSRLAGKGYTVAQIRQSVLKGSKLKVLMVEKLIPKKQLMERAIKALETEGWEAPAPGPKRNIDMSPEVVHRRDKIDNNHSKEKVR